MFGKGSPMKFGIGFHGIIFILSLKIPHEAGYRTIDQGFNIRYYNMSRQYDFLGYFLPLYSEQVNL